MSNDYLKSFYELSYTHDELEELLKKISNGELLTKEQYDILMAALDIVQGIIGFDGTYESLPDKPDIIGIVKDSNDFVTFDSFDVRSKTIQVSLEILLERLISELRDELEQSKSDINHTHDERYSLFNHDHDNRYATKNEIMNFVTRDYLDSIIAQLEGNGGSGGGVVSIYSKPSLSVTLDSLYIKHKEQKTITIKPVFKQNDAGPIKKVTITKDNVIIYESTEIMNHKDIITLNHLEKAVYEVIVQYEAGMIKNDSIGNPYPNHIKAGSISQKVTVQGVASSYYGAIGDKPFEVSDIDSLTSVENSTKGYTVTYNLDDQKSVYMYPKSFGDLTSIKDINNFDYINSYTLSVITYNDIVYNVYVLTDATSMDVGFKQVFS